MERYTFALKIKEGQYTLFRQRLGDIWPKFTAFLDQNSIRNFSMWSISDLIFGYCELPNNITIEESEQLQKQFLIQDFDNYFDWISNPGQPMRLMYHDYGVVRACKELIRHRVFITKLRPGCEEEYKKRHDRLILERGDKVTLGPSSNFSIWSAGGYIFGYNEIDVTMEIEQTPESLEAARKWETRQLEIMDWITNDMDWMTGEYHPTIHRIAWHN